MVLTVQLFSAFVHPRCTKHCLTYNEHSVWALMHTHSTVWNYGLMSTQSYNRIKTTHIVWTHTDGMLAIILSIYYFWLCFSAISCARNLLPIPFYTFALLNVSFCYPLSVPQHQISGYVRKQKSYVRVSGLFCLVFPVFFYSGKSSGSWLFNVTDASANGNTRKLFTHWSRSQTEPSSKP